MQPNPAYGIELDPETQLDQCDVCGCWAPREEMKATPGEALCMECDIDREPGDTVWAKP